MVPALATISFSGVNIFGGSVNTILMSNLQLNYATRRGNIYNISLLIK
jgi:hypothetical protein